MATCEGSLGGNGAAPAQCLSRNVLGGSDGRCHREGHLQRTADRARYTFPRDLAGTKVACSSPFTTHTPRPPRSRPFIPLSYTTLPTLSLSRKLCQRAWHRVAHVSVGSPGTEKWLAEKTAAVASEGRRTTTLRRERVSTLNQQPLLPTDRAGLFHGRTCATLHPGSVYVVSATLVHVHTHIQIHTHADALLLIAARPGEGESKSSALEWRRGESDAHWVLDLQKGPSGAGLGQLLDLTWKVVLNLVLRGRRARARVSVCAFVCRCVFCSVLVYAFAFGCSRMYASICMRVCMCVRVSE